MVDGGQVSLPQDVMDKLAQPGTLDQLSKILDEINTKALEIDQSCRVSYADYNKPMTL